MDLLLHGQHKQNRRAKQSFGAAGTAIDLSKKQRARRGFAPALRAALLGRFSKGLGHVDFCLRHVPAQILFDQCAVTGQQRGDDLVVLIHSA